MADDDDLRGILEESVAQLRDRLQNGDPYCIGGQVLRKPIAARDLAGIIATLSALSRDGAGPLGDSG